MKTLAFVFCLSSVAFANVSLSPSVPLFPEEGLLIAKESFATIKAGYFVDYNWRTHLSNDFDIDHAKTRSLAQYGALSLCLSDLVDLYGFVGSKTETLTFRKDQIFQKFKGHNLFTWALFADGILNQWGKLQLGAGAFYASLPKQKGTLTVGEIQVPDQYQYYMWGVQLGFSYDYPPISPYIRLDYQFIKALLDSNPNQDFYMQHPLGLAFGF